MQRKSAQVIDQHLSCNIERRKMLYLILKCTFSPRQVCHLSTEDLPELHKDADTSKCFMANKFNLHVDPVAVLCQAKAIVQKTVWMIIKVNQNKQ